MTTSLMTAERLEAFMGEEIHQRGGTGQGAFTIQNAGGYPVGGLAAR